MAKIKLLKVELSLEERARNARIFGKLVETILFPAIIIILFNFNYFSALIAIFWIFAEIISFFFDREKLVIENIWQIISNSI